jgi:hypothetical protein
LNRLLKIAVLLLLTLILLLGGCHKAAPPDGTAGSLPTTSIPQVNWPKQGTRPAGVLGLPMPVTLNQEDMDRISFVARTNSSWYQVEVKSFEWYAIVWADSSVPSTVWVVDEQTAAKGIPSYVNPNALWYPGMTLTHTEGGISYQIQVAFDYDSEKLVYSSGSFNQAN